MSDVLCCAGLTKDSQSWMEIFALWQQGRTVSVNRTLIHHWEAYLFIDTQRLCLRYSKSLIPKPLWSILHVLGSKLSHFCKLSPHCVVSAVPNNSNCSKSAWIVLYSKFGKGWKTPLKKKVCKSEKTTTVSYYDFFKVPTFGKQ